MLLLGEVVEGRSWRRESGKWWEMSGMKLGWTNVLECSLGSLNLTLKAMGWLRRVLS